MPTCSASARSESARGIHSATGSPAGVPNEPYRVALRPSKTSHAGRLAYPNDSGSIWWNAPPRAL